MALLQETGKGDIPGLISELEFHYDDEDMARAIFKAIEVDNYQFVRCRLEGRKIMCRVEGEKPSKLLHTIDDLLACLIVAEEAYRRL